MRVCAPRFSHRLFRGELVALPIGFAIQLSFGELYELGEPTLTLLDRLESHPSFYRRTRIALADRTGADTYLLQPAQVSGCPIIESGDWSTHIQAQQSSD